MDNEKGIPLPGYDLPDKKRWHRDREDGRWLVDIKPRIGTVNATSTERAIASIVKGVSVTEPQNESQADLMGDLMFAMYQRETTLKENVPPERQINQMLMKWVMSNPEYEKGKWSSIANLPAALTASTFTWEAITTEEALKEALEAQKKADDAKKELEELMQQMAKEKDDARQKAMAEQAGELEKQIQQQAEQGVKSIEKLQQNPLGQGMMSRSIKKGAEEGKKVADAMQGWGVGAGDIAPVDAQAVLKMFHQNKDKMRKIAELAGKFKQVSANSIEQTRKSYTGPVSEIRLTRDFMKLLPTERMAFSNIMPPILKTQKILNYTAHGLPGYIQKSEGKISGNFRAMVDGSGSMCGQNEEMAKAIALGVAYAVREDKQSDRHYKLTTFGDRDDDFVSVDDTQDWKEHVEWASIMPAGGTDFDSAFQRAIDEIRHSPYRGEDLLFITDGYAHMSDRMEQAWRELKEEKGSKLLYIGIGGSVNEDVKALSDLYVQVNNLDDIGEELVVQISQHIIKSELEHQGGD